MAFVCVQFGVTRNEDEGIESFPSSGRLQVPLGRRWESVDGHSTRWRRSEKSEPQPVDEINGLYAQQRAGAADVRYG